MAAFFDGDVELPGQKLASNTEEIFRDREIDFGWDTSSCSISTSPVASRESLVPPRVEQ